MRQLILWRHAKSSWSHPALGDHDRPLKKRGVRDCALMTPTLEQLILDDPRPLKIRLSTAERAVQTLEELRANCDHQRCRNTIDAAVTDPALYTFERDVLFEQVLTHAASVDRLMLIGHNPALISLARMLIGPSAHTLTHLPTAAVLVLGMDEHAGPWAAGQAQLLQSVRPSQFRD